jgi:hypothetical protein
MRVKRTARQGSEVSRAASGDLGVLLERQRAELEGCVAEAEQRAVEAQALADERIEQQRLECEARIQEEQRNSEERVEGERNALIARVDAAERRLEAAEEQAGNAEKKLKKAGLRPRAARKVAEAREALEEERARGAQLEARNRELEATLERERAETTSRFAELNHRLEEAGAEHAREHSKRIELEDRLNTELARGEEVRRRLETQAAAATTHRQRVEQLELDLREAREEASAERAERQGFEQRLQAVLLGEGAPRIRDQRSSGDEREFEAVKGQENVKRTSDGAPGNFEQTRPAQGASPDDSITSERFGSGHPPSPPEETRPRKKSSGARLNRRWRWRRRSSLPCAVCHRERPALSDAQLTESGWALSKSVALCAPCQEHGWRFPAGGAVPFRPAPGREPLRAEANELQASDSSRNR